VVLVPFRRKVDPLISMLVHGTDILKICKCYYVLVKKIKYVLFFMIHKGSLPSYLVVCRW